MLSGSAPREPQPRADLAPPDSPGDNTARRDADAPGSARRKRSGLVSGRFKAVNGRGRNLMVEKYPVGRADLPPLTDNPPVDAIMGGEAAFRAEAAEKRGPSRLSCGAALSFMEARLFHVRVPPKFGGPCASGGGTAQEAKRHLTLLAKTYTPVREGSRACSSVFRAFPRRNGRRTAHGRGGSGLPFCNSGRRAVPDRRKGKIADNKQGFFNRGWAKYLLPGIVLQSVLIGDG